MNHKTERLLPEKTHDQNNPDEISVSTDKDSEYISDEIMRFNERQVPFTQKVTPVFKKYVIKNKNEIIAGINAVIYPSHLKLRKG